MKKLISQTKSQSKLATLLYISLAAITITCTTIRPMIKYCLASGHKDIKIWNPLNWKPIEKQPEMKLPAHVSSIAFSQNGKYLAATSDCNITIWNAKTYTKIEHPEIKHQGRINSIAFSPNGKLLASGSDDSNIFIWDTQNWKVIISCSTISENQLCYRVKCVAFSPNGKLLASVSNDDIRIWDTETWEEKAIIKNGAGHQFNTAITFSPDNRYLAFASTPPFPLPSQIQIWNTQTWKQIKHPIMVHPDFIYRIAFSPNGNYLASCSNKGTIYRWNTNTWKQILHPSIEYYDIARSIAFSPDGKYLASGSDCGEIYIFNTKDWSHKDTINHKYPVLKFRLRKEENCYIDSIVFSPLLDIPSTLGKKIKEKKKYCDITINVS